METVLWYQNAEIDKPDGFVIDGEHQFNEDTHIQQEAFTTLINGRKWPKARSLSIMKRRHPNASDQLEIYINQSGELMVQSHFINRDEKGRLITYMFYTKNVDSILSDLKEYAQKAGLKPNEDDLIIVKEVLGLRKNRAVIYIGGAVVVGLIALLLWK